METLKETFIRSDAKYLKAEIDRAGEVTWDKSFTHILNVGI